MTDQCTFTGRYDRLSRAPAIIKRGTGGDAFDAHCEAGLAQQMAERVAAERAFHRDMLHGPVSHTVEYGQATFAQAQKKSKNGNMRAANRARAQARTKNTRDKILGALERGALRTAAEVAEALGLHPKTVRDHLAVMREDGRVRRKAVAGGAFLWSRAQ